MIVAGKTHENEETTVLADASLKRALQGETRMESMESSILKEDTRTSLLSSRFPDPHLA